MIIAESRKIKEALLKRWEEMDLIQPPKENGERYRGFNSIIADATEKAAHMKITQDRLSKYVHGGYNKPLTEKQVIWLCIRYGIPVGINIGVIEIDNGKMKQVIPPYNEKKCLKDLSDHAKLFDE